MPEHFAIVQRTPRISLPGEDSDKVQARLRARIVTLEIELDDARTQIKQILSDPEGLNYGWRFPVEWGLTKMEHTALCVLMHRGAISKESLFTALYEGRLDQPDPKVVDVVICKLRPKYTGKIITLWGRGYEISDAERIEMRAKYFREPPKKRVVDVTNDNE